MNKTIRAVFEHGVLRPLDELKLVENTEVMLTVEYDPPDSTSAIDTADPLAGIKFSSGIPDLAENFDAYRFGKNP